MTMTSSSSMAQWACLAVMLFAAPCGAQQLLYGRCPNYQTTSDFNEAYVDKMVANTEGYIVIMSNGAMEPCQRLKFTDRNDYNLSFVDIANYIRNHTDRYTVEYGNPSKPAKVNLSLLPRLLGADLLGRLDLYPLIAKDDLLVFSSCAQFGIFYSEQVLVFAPFTGESPSTVDISAVLKEARIPKQDQLKMVSQDCTPGQASAPQPLPLRMYNLLVSLSNPFTITGAIGSTPSAAVASSAPASTASAPQLFSALSRSPGSLYLQQQQQIQHQAAGQPLFYSNVPTHYSSAASPVGGVQRVSLSAAASGLYSPALQQPAYAASPAALQQPSYAAAYGNNAAAAPQLYSMQTPVYQSFSADPSAVQLVYAI